MISAVYDTNVLISGTFWRGAPLSSTEADRVLGDVLTYARVVTPTRSVDICRDDKDNVVLACALAGQAEYVVTGDPDLLTLAMFEAIKIVTVRDFLSTVQAG
jgi:predicted nucleic acid-binding protein